MAHRGVVPTHVLIVVQNLPVPLDRRVWLECQALRAAGFEVTVICPKGPGDPSHHVADGVDIHQYRPAPEAWGLLGYVLEFGYSWLRIARLAEKVWRRHPFQVLQACNPPDTYWLLARAFRARGVRFVFDQHDLNPELFRSRFGEPTGFSSRLQLRALQWLERKTYDTADHVISTNASYRRVAVERGGLDPDDVTVVRSGPDTRAMRPVRIAATTSRQVRYNLAYLGVMGPQDGVGTILDVMHELVHVRGRDDVEATLMGFGDCLRGLRARCTDLDLDGVVAFTGRVDGPVIAERLSSADVGLCPDLKTPLNDVSTMNKTMEYMAYALPSVAFDLAETRVSGGEACFYVPSGDVVAFADAVERLLDDPELRLRMARTARDRCTGELDWAPQAAAYVSVFERFRPRLDVPGARGAGDDGFGHDYVDLESEDEFRAYVLAHDLVGHDDRLLGA